METLREDFLRVYANIPLNLRGNIILIFEGKPINWNVAYVEIKANTDEGLKILKELRQLNLI